ncbi:uncharacterized protein SPSK_07978 [Sporothrix schenckii 1099-18]|uniref:EKC/KEOPS complex subunit CGI121 n=2 Tax=Sporothrix schenckii TaxID=29908 RepID=U7PJC2_SPOS1|nr:uncharacterized protein SPSK_07978 [Sporothrix schenckii 1099-18]ERS94834.1 hypothetical protein HMPREF1624_08731 [Sporothrix schenckii ATCC 58251]KJR89021.1 hypothetical protein SPSK_07978 [Sporothrix schenckii 1099-18]
MELADFAVAIEHLPPGYAVYAALFTDAANAAFLQAQLVARNADFEYALIDAATVVSRTHLLAAVYKAVLAHKSGTLKTPNVHSEAVLSLSPSLNIAEAYRRYGITADTRNVVAVKVLLDGADPAPVWEHLAEHVQGTPTSLSDSVALAKCTDLARVRKYYKLNGVPSLAGNEDTPAKRHQAEVLVLGAMALRGL